VTNLLLFGPHAVIVEPVDDRLGADAQLGSQLFERRLVRIGVPLERVTEGGLLRLGEEHARFLLSRRRRQLTVAKLVVRVGRRTLHARCNTKTTHFVTTV